MKLELDECCIHNINVLLCIQVKISTYDSSQNDTGEMELHHPDFL